MEIVKDSHGRPVKVLGYHVAYCEPEILGSGSTYTRMAQASTEVAAMSLLADRRNDLTRTVKQADGSIVHHWYDIVNKVWKDSQNNIV